MGPCQGGFCIYRATGILHGLDGLSAEEADRALLDFLQERWKGTWPILYGDQLRQARFDDWIFQGVLDVGAPAEPRWSRPGKRRERALRRGRDRRRHGRADRGHAAGAGRAQVCVLAKGVGSTHLAPGTIDVLGYTPERVDVAARGARRG